MKKDDLKELFKKAADIASEVPENMQQIAFTRALDIFLEEVPVTKAITGRKTGERKRKPAKKTEKKTEDAPIELVLQKLDRTKYPAMYELSNTLDRSLFLLKIVKDTFDIDGLTPPQIAKIITEKFRKKTYRQNVSRDLSKATKYVDRIPVGNAKKYRIMQPGEDYLNKIISEKKTKK